MYKGFNLNMEIKKKTLESFGQRIKYMNGNNVSCISLPDLFKTEIEYVTECGIVL